MIAEQNQTKEIFCLNYPQFDHSGDLFGEPYTWYLSRQFFLTLLGHF